MLFLLMRRQKEQDRKSLGLGDKTWIWFPPLVTPEGVTLGKMFGIFASISSPCKMDSTVFPSSSDTLTF